MFRILVANRKGGCGKTTLTTTLAGCFARRGTCTTLVDCDPQGSSLAWCGLHARIWRRCTRSPATTPTHGLSAGWLLRIPANTEVLLIDTPAGLLAHEFERFARRADVLLIPVVPSPIDLRATLLFIDIVRRLQEFRSGRLRVALIANRLRERTLSAKQLDVTLDRMTQAEDPCARFPGLCRPRRQRPQYLRRRQQRIALAPRGLECFAGMAAGARRRAAARQYHAAGGEGTQARYLIRALDDTLAIVAVTAGPWHEHPPEPTSPWCRGRGAASPVMPAAAPARTNRACAPRRHRR